MWIEFQDRFQTLWADMHIRAAVILVGSILTAYLTELVMRRILVVLARKTDTEMDDKIIAVLRRPIFLTVIFSGLAWALSILVTGTLLSVAYASIKTLAILTWASAAFQTCAIVIEGLSARAGERSVVQPRTVPLFDMMSKIGVIGITAYFTFLAWEVDVTAWLASAGIVGIAVGFASKDSLAHVVAGIFILMDAPYKVGDFIVLDGNLRGKVTRIGMRSTRILTLDDVEITIPNALIGNANILNEAGGPNIKQRIHIEISAAWTSDVDQVSNVLLGCAEGVPELCTEPRPEVQLRAVRAQGLDFHLLVWIVNAAARDRIISKLNMIVLKRLREAGIEIPYSKQDVYIKEMPARSKARDAVVESGRDGER